MKFSILVPGIPSRSNDVVDFLAYQASSHDDVEVLYFMDNKRRSIGSKRDALVRIAQGDYIAFVDDDDWVSDNYVDEIVKAIDASRSVGLEPDVITFLQQSSHNGSPYIVDFGLTHDNEPAECNRIGVYKDIKRKPWHVCPWRRSLAGAFRFPDTSYGEDWGWISQFIHLAKTEHKIDKILHYYRFDDKVSEAANGTSAP